MRKLVSDHAEDVGGQIVEPGADFDETEADEETVQRLEDEGKLADASESKSKSSKGN